MASASENFPGTSAYTATVTFTQTGNGSGTYSVSVKKNSGTGYWTSGSYDYSVSFRGSTIRSATWVYDFRDYSSKTIYSGTWSGAPAGTHSYGASVEMGNGAGTASPSGSIAVSTEPGSPGTPSVSNITSSSAAFSWSGAASNNDSIDNTQFQIDDNSSFSSPETITLSGNATSYTKTGIPRADTFYVRVRQSNKWGYGQWSGTRSFTTKPEKPDAPGTPTASGVGANTATISWSAPGDNGGASITGYTLQRATNSTFTQGVVTYTQTGTSKTFTDLDPSTTYYFRVAATNSAGTGSYSGTRSIATFGGFYLSRNNSWVPCAVYVSRAGAWVAAEVYVSRGGVWVAAS